MNAFTVGLVGAGGISYAHVPAWLALGARVRVHSEVGAEALAEAFGIEVADSLDSLLGDADLVDVCTPTPAHAEICLSALEAGRDVVCEKPLARTAADAAAVARRARELGRRLLPGHVVRYFPEYAALHTAVEAGRIGRPAVLRFTRGGTAPTAAWFHDEKLSGGIVLDQMIHDIDQARWLAGEVVDVRAAANRRGDVVVAQATLRHASGAISFVQGVWGARGVAFGSSFDIAGSEGRLRYDSRARIELDENLPPDGGGSSYLPTLGSDSPFITELDDFARAILGDAVPRVDAEDGVAAIAIAEAALASIADGDTHAVETHAMELAR